MDNAPDEEDTGGDLHDCGGEGGADKAWVVEGLAGRQWKGKGWEKRTESRMHDLQHRYRLRPLGKLSHAAVNILKADQWHEEEDAAEDGDPGDGGDEVVEDQVLGLKGWRARAGGKLLIHCESKVRRRRGRKRSEDLCDCGAVGVGLTISLAICTCCRRHQGRSANVLPYYYSFHLLLTVCLTSSDQSLMGAAE